MAHIESIDEIFPNLSVSGVIVATNASIVFLNLGRSAGSRGTTHNSLEPLKTAWHQIRLTWRPTDTSSVAHKPLVTNAAVGKNLV